MISFGSLRSMIGHLNPIRTWCRWCWWSCGGKDCLQASFMCSEPSLKWPIGQWPLKNTHQCSPTRSSPKCTECSPTRSWPTTLRMVNMTKMFEDFRWHERYMTIAQGREHDETRRQRCRFGQGRWEEKEGHCIDLVATARPGQKSQENWKSLGFWWE